VAESVELATILLTDLVGSTRLATSVGPVRADELREEHFGLLRQAIASTGGPEVKNLGDGLMVAFGSASGAVSCAVAMQQLFERRYGQAEQGLHVRIGLGAGESTVKDGDYFGMPTVEAARLCAQAPADGILISAPEVRAVGALGGYGLFGGAPGDASLLQFLYAIHAHGGVVATGGITGGAQQNRVTGGSQRIPDSLASRIGAENIILNAPVRAIDQTGRRVVITTDAGRVQAGAVILAIPPTFAAAIDYQPKLPIRRAQLTERFPMGYAVKVHAVYPKPFWRHLTARYPHTPDGLCGIVASKNGPISLCFDNSPGGGEGHYGGAARLRVRQQRPGLGLQAREDPASGGAGTVRAVVRTSGLPPS